MNFFTKRNLKKAERTQAIKAKVSEMLSLNQDVTVVVTELNCQDEDCPKVVTVIAIFVPSKPKIPTTLNSSIEEITDGQIERLCQNLQDHLQPSEMTLVASTIIIPAL